MNQVRYSVVADCIVCAVHCQSQLVCALIFRAFTSVFLRLNYFNSSTDTKFNGDMIAEISIADPS